MFKLIKENAIEGRKKLQRRRRKDRLRNERIKACTEQLRTNPTFSVGEFLRNLSNDGDLLGEGKKKCNLTNMNFIKT